ncbi:MAG: hypothetical protein R3E68_23360 [Burkholderiaceae bacterium]
MTGNASRAVSFIAHQEPLRLFAQAIAGRAISVLPATGLAQGFRLDQGDTRFDGRTLTLPESIDLFDEPLYNFRTYRLAILHQIGFAQGGCFALDPQVLDARLPGLPDAWFDAADPGLPLEQWLAALPRPLLARRVFVLLEGWRTDLLLAGRYPGARADLARSLARALEARPDLQRMSGLARVIELLTRLTLGADRQALGANSASERIDALLSLTDLDRRMAPDVYDTAQVTMDVLQWLARLGLLSCESGEGNGTDDRPDAADAAQAGGTEPAQGDGDDDAPGGPALAHRGDPLADESVAQRRKAGALARSAPPATAAAAPGEDPAAGQRAPALQIETPWREGDAPTETRIDEWDHLAGHYRRGWCRLIETRLHGEAGDLPRRLLTEHRDLALRIRRQFARLRAESVRLQRRLPDGDEIDLDRLIEARVNRRARRAGDDRLYQRRERIRRDVAAAFLLDMSASTDFPVPEQRNGKPPTEPTLDTGPEDEGWVYGFSPASLDLPPPTERRRVIDVARDALGLMSLAMETLGDPFAVYGFSGQGREHVSFHVARDFDDRRSSANWGALAAIRPEGSTRMGAAVRHANNRLARVHARLKVLIIVSDGYPQDLDYGPDRNSDEYGLQDTAMALHEAQRRGIETFCLTVDPAGHDYLKRMCPDQRYAVIDEIDKLPEALTKVYQAITR